MESTQSASSFTANTMETVRQDIVDKNAETNAAETPAEPVTLTAEYHSGEFRTNYEGDFNDHAVFDFQVTATLEKTVCSPGDTLKISTRAENVGSDFMYSYIYDYPEPYLQLNLYVNQYDRIDGMTKYCIYPDVPLYPDALPNDTIAETGETWGRSNTFTIPEVIPEGKYDLIIKFRGYQTIIKEAVEIVY